jgi:predicted ATPase/class 3 adenylate cyclase
MKCAECDHENREGSKFCTVCGAALYLMCLRCAAPIVESDRFCSGCGARVNSTGAVPQLAPPIEHSAPATSAAASPSLSAERKNVTVLFADISGFTAMSEKLDPEDVANVTNSCLKLMADTVVRYEGYIDKFIGDCIMAIFGAPITHENDPELAVRAALDMNRALKQFNTELPVKLEKPLTLHTGINSGMVIAGAVGSDQKMDYTVMGDTVNLASRLESIGGPGQIFISGYTHNLTRGLFEVNALEPIKVKGKKDPVAIYEVIKAKSGKAQTRKTDAALVPLVGRDEELDRLAACAERLSDGRGQAVFLISEPGIGKSRLEAEFKSRLAGGDIQTIEGTCRSFGQSTSYYVFADILRNLCDIDSEDLPGFMASKIAKHLPLLLHLDPEALDAQAREAVVFLGAILGLELSEQFDIPVHEMDAQERKTATFRALAWLLRSLASQRPLQMVVENLHFADNASIEALGYLFEALRDDPVMLVGLMRPAKDQASAKLIAIAREILADAATEIEFDRLDQVDSDKMVQQLLRSDQVPEDVLALVWVRAGGNPLYIEEIIRSMVDDGVIEQAEDGNIRVARDLDEIEMPSSIQGIIIARVDKLQSGMKDVLQTASVIGPMFDHALLQRMMDVEDLDDKLDRLCDMGLIFESSSFPAIEYSFRNILIQEAVYSTMLLKTRRKAHLAVGREIEKFYGARLEDQFEVLAEHFRLGEDPPRAFEFTLNSGNKAKRSHANENAADFFRRAIAIGESLGESEVPLFEVHVAYSDTQELLGDVEGAIASWQKAIALIDEALPRADALRNIGRIEEKRGDPERAMAAYSEAEEILAEYPDAVETGMLLTNQSWVLNRQGEGEAAIEKANRALAIFEALEATTEIAQVCNNLAVIYEHAGNLEKALDYNRRSLDLTIAIGNKRRTGNVCMSMGYLHRRRDEPEVALDYFDRAFETMTRIGNMFGAGSAAMLKGQCYIDLARLEEAEDALKGAMRLHRELGLDVKILANALALATVYLSTGDIAAVRTHLSAAKSLANGRNAVLEQAEVARLEARLAIQEGKKPEAKFAEAIKLFKAAKHERNAAETKAELAEFLKGEAGAK